MPYQGPEEEQQEPVQPSEPTAKPPDLPSETTAQPADQPAEKQQASSSHISSTSLSTKTLQSTLTSQATESKEDDGDVTAHGAELRVAPQTTQLEDEAPSWSRPCVSTQFHISSAPSAPALYPSLPTLEEGPVLQLCEEALKSREKGPAVLALPEQESSPPSLQPQQSVAELSRSKLYPELPKTAPEIQVILFFNFFFATAHYYNRVRAVESPVRGSPSLI